MQVMGKLFKTKRARFAALIASLILCAASLFGIAYFALKILYVPLVICIIVAIASIYAIPFLFFSCRKG